MEKQLAQSLCLGWDLHRWVWEGPLKGDEGWALAWVEGKWSYSLTANHSPAPAPHRTDQLPSPEVAARTPPGSTQPPQALGPLLPASSKAA